MKKNHYLVDIMVLLTVMMFVGFFMGTNSVESAGVVAFITLVVVVRKLFFKENSPVYWRDVEE